MPRVHLLMLVLLAGPTSPGAAWTHSQTQSPLPSRRPQQVLCFCFSSQTSPVGGSVCHLPLQRLHLGPCVSPDLAVAPISQLGRMKLRNLRLLAAAQGQFAKKHLALSSAQLLRTESRSGLGPGAPGKKPHQSCPRGQLPGSSVRALSLSSSELGNGAQAPWESKAHRKEAAGRPSDPVL